MSSEAIEAPATAKTAVPVDTTSISAHQRRKLDRSGKSQIVVTGILVIVAIYFLVPLYWVIIAATKTTGALFATNGFWFGGDFALFSNIQQVFTYDGGIFVRWIANSILYSGVGAVLATYFAAAGGYALANRPPKDERDRRKRERRDGREARTALQTRASARPVVTTQADTGLQAGRVATTEGTGR